MAVSAFAMLYFSRGTTFSADEMVIVVTTPDFDVRTALQPHAGHLLLIPRLVYWPLLNIFGLDYLPYRMLTAGSVCLTVGFLFTWLIRRIPEWVALVPCLILLFFGTDHLHVLQGNGFVICFALAMGLLALLQLERGDRRGDVVACVALVAAAATYSVGLPFIAGAATLVLLNRQWRRLWVPAIPFILYLAWFVWSKSQDFSGANQAEISAITDFPRWIFEASGASLYALSGLSFDWASGDQLDLIDVRSAIIAALFIGSVVWCVVKGRATKSLWVVLVVALSLWGLQVLVSQHGGRLPDDARYLYPGAVVCVLILGAAAQGLRWSKAAIVALYLVGAAGLLTNFVLLERNGDFYRDTSLAYRGYVGAVVLTAQTYAAEDNEAALQEVDANDLVTDKPAAVLMADSPYGDFAATPQEMLQLPEEQRLLLDAALVNGIGISREPAGDFRPSQCDTQRAGDDGLVSVDLAVNRVIVESAGGLPNLLIGRFGSGPSVDLGPLKPGERVVLTIPPDQSDVSWKIGGAGKSIKVCSAGSR